MGQSTPLYYDIKIIGLHDALQGHKDIFLFKKQKTKKNTKKLSYGYVYIYYT